MEVSPSALEFKGSFTKQTTEHLTLTNTASTALAFKVKTTAPKLYCVRPNASIVQPGDSIKISIILQGFSQPLPQDYKCKDKFLLVSLPCPDLSDTSKVGDNWSLLEAKYKSQVVSKKLRVNYVVTDEHEENGNGGVTPGAGAGSAPESAHDDFNSSHINNTVINDAQTAHATPFKGNGTVAAAAAAAAAETPISASAASRIEQFKPKSNLQRELEESSAPVNDLNSKLDERSYPQTPQQASHASGATPVRETKVEHRTPHREQEEYSEKPAVRTPVAGSQSEPVSGISYQLAIILIIIAFLIGWLIF